VGRNILLFARRIMWDLLEHALVTISDSYTGFGEDVFKLKQIFNFAEKRCKNYAPS
jgi:hypothetical protein